MDNRQAISYMQIACNKAGLSYESMRKITTEMYYAFDLYTEEEAEERANTIPINSWNDQKY